MTFTSSGGLWPILMASMRMRGLQMEAKCMRES